MIYENILQYYNLQMFKYKSRTLEVQKFKYFPKTRVINNKELIEQEF